MQRIKLFLPFNLIMKTNRFLPCKRLNSKCSSYLKHVKRDEKNRQFVEAFPEVINTLSEYCASQNLPHLAPHLEEMVEFTVLKLKRFRHTVVLEAYKALETPEGFSEDKYRLVIMLAWCFELTLAAMVVQDDLWDQTEIRANDISWYKKPNVGHNAITDGKLLYEGALVLLRKYFASLKQYGELKELFNEMKIALAKGQVMDWSYKRNGKLAYETFNMDTYRVTARYKAGMPIFAFPFAGALSMTGNMSLWYGTKDVIADLGLHFQVDNDILDIYDKHGRLRPCVGSDIREGKRTWVAVKILESNSEGKIESFKANYGRAGRDCEEQVVRIANELNIYEKYLDHHSKSKKMMEKRTINMMPSLRKAVLSTVENVLPTLAE
ncbi:farnesyl pyrophosphate synthase 2-like [Photinus pyralis]|uniref:farnesyl pyrophosphate synthase 2-like n=1 Tax=Photinus pyralis TaxID=7054 RepID=UPI0012670D4D|nr:farnesyl pyrophosphate synthase 2-like [Photinus pyralis]